MNVVSTNIPDVLIFEPKIFNDERGYFYESYNHNTFEKITNRTVNFVQDNHSKSTKGVLRGMHFQLPPFEQAKLVRCTSGIVFDVAVDIRRNSDTFGNWVGVHLSAENKRQLWIPEGFAHGFMVLSETAEFLYKTTNYYNPASERGVLWSDEQLNIPWHDTNSIIVSSKDAALPLLKDAIDLF